MTLKNKIKEGFTNLYEKGNKYYRKVPFHYVAITIAALIIIITLVVLVLSTEVDETPPTLEVITKDISVYEGESVTIEVNFSDNEKVTSADLYYKKMSDTNFSSISIINQTVTIPIPSGSGEDWEYYVVIDDAAGNGPVGKPSINGSITYDIFVLKIDDDTNITTGYQRYVFIEEASAESCHNCPEVAQSLHELSESGEYNFHYVTLIEEDPKAKTRMQAYNVQGYPVVFVDGGYQTFLGTKTKQVYENAIQSALDRETADIQINLTAQYDETTNNIDLSVTIFNNETNEYTGRLKVYLAEVVSTKYQDADGEQYRNAFLEFAIDKDISITSNSNITETKSLEGFDPENLLVYAVVFSDEKQEKFQNEDQEQYPFNAYYVDGCIGVRVVEGGNLPPSISINFPQKGKVYLRGNKINLLDRFTFQQTILLGQCNFTVEANDKDGIERIELYIDGELAKEFSNSSIDYVYRNSRIFQFSHTIRFTAYDTEGKESSASIDILAFTLKAQS